MEANNIKKLIHFKRKSNFVDQNVAGNIPDTSIVFIKDSNEIHTRGTTYSFIKWSRLENPFITSMDAKAGDICLYDINNSKLVLTTQDKLVKLDVNSYEPVGVVVVPGSHNVYGDGSCGIMSIKTMDYSNPENGAAAVSGTTAMYWGTQTDTSLFGYTKIVVYASDGSLTTNNFCYLSKDGSYNYSTLHAPDPYNADGSRNPDYYTTSGTTNANYNALSDFKGKSNSNVILTKRGTKDYSTWTLTNTASNYPAATCCDMFYTSGTSQKDWYLPACGELSYVMAKWSDVQSTLSFIKTVYGENTAATMEDENGYWTSTENATKNARYVHMSNGVGYANKDSNYTVRAFLKFKN